MYVIQWYGVWICEWILIVVILYTYHRVNNKDEEYETRQQKQERKLFWHMHALVLMTDWLTVTKTDWLSASRKQLLAKVLSISVLYVLCVSLLE